jgi:hypothetical protein
MIRDCDECRRLQEAEDWAQLATNRDLYLEARYEYEVHRATHITIPRPGQGAP